MLYDPPKRTVLQPFAWQRSSKQATHGSFSKPVRPNL